MDRHHGKRSMGGFRLYFPRGTAIGLIYSSPLGSRSICSFTFALRRRRSKSSLTDACGTSHKGKSFSSMTRFIGTSLLLGVAEPVADGCGSRFRWLAVTRQRTVASNLVERCWPQCRERRLRMIHESDSATRATRKAHRFSFGEFLCRIAKPLFVTVLAVLIFLLGQAMVQHRFFRGGRYHANGSVGQ
jgi:hypothetical protein